VTARRGAGEIASYVAVVVLAVCWRLPFGLLGALLGRGARRLATGVLR
jgi:hypothetical protein